jgi:hypothetical protein
VRVVLDIELVEEGEEKGGRGQGTNHPKPPLAREQTAFLVA